MTSSFAIQTQRPLRILHLGFEDPLMPGAGGGSVRTHEINRRIAASGHTVTVLTTKYPGSIDRVQDGVHYIPLGFGTGKTRLSRLIGYCARVPLATWKRRPGVDLVVEDFFAPFSTMAAPLWTGKPTIGMVQWLHAREKFREYKIPVHWIERAGVRRYKRMIAVSEGTRDQLLQLHPDATVQVISNGIDTLAMDTPLQVGRDVVCIGRLEFMGKGIDILLEAWAHASHQIDGNLIIAGTGPDEQKIRASIAARKLGNSVRLVGWVSGRAKFDLLSGARLVVVPSRVETFGLVAVESLASGTPVVAFDIPCLREVIPLGCGWTVPPFNAVHLADEMVRRYNDEADLVAAGMAGRTFASSFSWDVLAREQLNAYYDVVRYEMASKRGRKVDG